MASMPLGFSILLACLLLGQVVGDHLGLPVPGSVLGMGLLTLLLALGGRAPEGLTRSARGLLGVMPVLFVPAGAGIIEFVGRIRSEWLPIAAALLASTLLTVAATGWTLQFLLDSASRLGLRAKEPRA